MEKECIGRVGLLPILQPGPRRQVVKSLLVGQSYRTLEFRVLYDLAGMNKINLKIGF